METVYPVELPGYPEGTSGLSEADCLAALQDVPKEWDYVVDNPRRGVEAHLREVPGYARYYEASDRYFPRRGNAVLTELRGQRRFESSQRIIGSQGLSTATRRRRRRLRQR